LIPTGSIVNSFGLFDGNIEVDLAFNQRFVIARTSKYVIYEFWHTLLNDPTTIAQIAQSLFPIKQEAIFNILQESWPKYKDPHVRSAIFFLLNRCSDTGLLSAGQLTNESFNTFALTLLKNFRIDNFHLLFDQDENLGHLLSEIPLEEYVIFPSLNFSFNLLTHGKIRSFETTPTNHVELKKAIEPLEHKILLIYRYHPHLFSLYEDYKTMMIDKYGQETTDKDKCQEVIVANF